MISFHPVILTQYEYATDWLVQPKLLLGFSIQSSRSCFCISRFCFPFFSSCLFFTHKITASKCLSRVVPLTAHVKCESHRAYRLHCNRNNQDAIDSTHVHSGFQSDGVIYRGKIVSPSALHYLYVRSNARTMPDPNGPYLRR